MNKDDNKMLSATSLSPMSQCLPFETSFLSHPQGFCHQDLWWCRVGHGTQRWVLVGKSVWCYCWRVWYKPNQMRSSTKCHDCWKFGSICIPYDVFFRLGVWLDVVYFLIACFEKCYAIFSPTTILFSFTWQMASSEPMVKRTGMSLDLYSWIFLLTIS